MAKKSKKSKSIPKLDLHGSLDVAVAAAEKYADKAKAMVEDLQWQLSALKELQTDLLHKYNAAVAKAADLAGDLVGDIAKKVPASAGLVSTRSSAEADVPAQPPVAAKKATAKKAPVKKATAKKTTVKKATAKKTAKKAPAKKAAVVKAVPPAPEPPAEPPVL